MSTNTAAGTARASYGNWVEQRSVGLGGAGLLGTAVLLGGLMTTMLSLLFAGLSGALVVLVVSAIAFAATGTPIGARLIRRVAYTRARLSGEHQWRSGVFSRNVDTAIRLPGILGRLSLLERGDPFGTPFVVIKNPLKGGLYTVVARCIADGPWLQDQDRLDHWVAAYAGALNAYGQDPALICAKAITDTAPDPGGRLAQLVRSARVENSPAIARQVMEECLADYPATSSENITYVELTFRGRDLHRKGNETTILSELARKIPGVLGQLGAAGGGAVTMVTKTELAALVRVAYDPASQPYLEQAALNAAGAGPGHQPYVIEWADAGPVAAQEFWDNYVHDSGRSITWEMHGAPRAAITELQASALLMPHRDFTRKRVALIYRPHSADESVRVSENDANGARFMASQSKKRMTALAGLRMKATDQSRQEVASGAVMVRFSLLVTTTVIASNEAARPDATTALAHIIGADNGRAGSEEIDAAAAHELAPDLDQASATLRSRAGQVPISLRRSYGSQAAAFAATLPVGFVPWEHTVISPRVREML